MTTLSALLFLGFVPVLYLGTGLVLSSLGPRSVFTPATIPAVGIVYWGFVGLLRLMTGWPPTWWYALTAVGIVAVALTRRDTVRQRWTDWSSCVRPWLLLYGFGFVVVAVAAYPGIWLMGGDWWYHLEMVLAAKHGTFGVTELARCPFFSLAALPLLDLGGKLAAFQIFHAAATAAAWLPMVVRLRTGEPGTDRLRQLALAAFMLTPAFTVVQQNLWPKFFAGGLLWLALEQARKWVVAGEPRQFIAAIGWLACGILTHESILLFVPLVLIAALRGPQGWRGPGFGTAAKAVLLGVGVVGIWEGWTILHFGWAARVAANPTVAFHVDLPWWSRIPTNLLDVVTGFLPIHLPAVWRGGEGFAAHAYYTAVAVVSALGATLLGTALPWLIWARPVLRDAWKRIWAGAADRWLVLGAGIALLGYGAIHTALPPYGAVQGGLVPLVMIAVYAAVRDVGVEDEKRVRRLLGWGVLAGWLPYCGIGLLVGLILQMPGRFAALIERLRTNDGDLWCVFAAKLDPLGMQPLFLALAAIGAMAIAWWALKTMRVASQPAVVMPVTGKESVLT